MPGALRSVIAGVAGVVTAFAVVAIGEAIGHAVYPLPEGMDFSDPVKVRELVASMPLGAFLFVLGSWIAATFAGGFVAGAIARAKAMPLALVVGGLMMAACLANLFLIPHPTWFAVATVVGVPAAAWSTGRTMGSRVQGRLAS